jgi:organic radical activating enzyme
VDDALVEELHRAGFYVAGETNGTHALPDSVDWVTWSPKDGFNDHVPPLALSRIDEVKVVFDGEHNPEHYSSLAVGAYLCLQPCDTGDPDRNRETTRQCVDYILRHPHWHLSLQTHKMIHIQ